MRGKIKEIITKRLESSPLSVISAVIYGSCAREEQSERSDIDILLISDGLNPKRHRRGKEIALIKGHLFFGYPLDILLLTPEECISNFRNHNPLFLDIASEGIVLKDTNDFIKDLIDETKAYISQRGLKKLPDGWSFPVLYREPTLLSSISNQDFAIVMLTDGEHDHEIGIHIIKKGYYDKAVYHFQQAIEKAIKAVLIAFGEFKKTHFVGDILVDKLREVEIAPSWKERLYHIAKISSEVEPEVTWSRYPGIDSDTLWVPYREYTIDDAVEVRAKSEKVINVVKEFISWWFRLENNE